MPPDWIAYGLALFVASTAPGERPPNAFAAMGGAVAGALTPAPPAFRPFDRTVTNWRRQALTHLILSGERAVRIATLNEPAGLPRCIRLNNYWCVKRAGWNGEIAADAEGHVAFASAPEGALVAAALLRRYYVDYGRKSAAVILASWAPAQCGLSGPAARGLAKRGVGGTLRARWLAAHRPGFTGKRRAAKGVMRRSVVADVKTPMLRAPSIASGMGERAAGLVPPALARLDTLTPRPAGAAGPRVAVASCASENARLANYARGMVAGLGVGPADDLKLFDAEGEPTATLAPAMVNMARVEIGPYEPDPRLADEAVAALRQALAARREAAALKAAAEAASRPD